jgi:hypothetical protein
MTERRPRRIVRRAVMVVAVVVLLLSGYLSAFISAAWLYGHGTISYPTFATLRDTVFAPANWYGHTYFPGGPTLGRCVEYAHNQGKGQPLAWKDCRGW